MRRLVLSIIGCVLSVGVAAATGAPSSQSAPPLKRYSVERGVTIAIPGDWKVVAPSGAPYVFEAQDRKQPVRFSMAWTRVSVGTGTLETLAGLTVKNLRKKLAGQHFALVISKIVRLPAGRAARIVYRATLSGGSRGEFNVYQLLHGDRWYVLEYQAASLALARAYAERFSRSARSLRFTA
jgi:hypothetical protein